MIHVLAEGAATAANTGAQPGGSYQVIIMLILMIAIFYFMIIRPNSKQQKKHRELVQALSAGTEVVTSGGLIGKITTVHENFVTLEISEGVEIIMQRGSVGAILPKDTIKNIAKGSKSD